MRLSRWRLLTKNARDIGVLRLTIGTTGLWRCHSPAFGLQLRRHIAEMCEELRNVAIALTREGFAGAVDLGEDFVFRHGSGNHQLGGRANDGADKSHGSAGVFDSPDQVRVVDVLAVPRQQEIHRVCRRDGEV